LSLRPIFNKHYHYNKIKYTPNFITYNLKHLGEAIVTIVFFPTCFGVALKNTFVLVYFYIFFYQCFFFIILILDFLLDYLSQDMDHGFDGLIQSAAVISLMICFICFLLG